MDFYIEKRDIDNNITGTIATFNNLDVAMGLYINLLEEDNSNTIYDLGIKYFSEITENLDLDILYSISGIEYNKLNSGEKTKLYCEILSRVSDK